MTLMITWRPDQDRPGRTKTDQDRTGQTKTDQDGPGHSSHKELFFPGRGAARHRPSSPQFTLPGIPGDTWIKGSKDVLCSIFVLKNVTLWF